MLYEHSSEIISKHSFKDFLSEMHTHLNMKVADLPQAVWLSEFGFDARHPGLQQPWPIISWVPVPSNTFVRPACSSSRIMQQCSHSVKPQHLFGRFVIYVTKFESSSFFSCSWFHARRTFLKQLTWTALEILIVLAICLILITQIPDYHYFCE